MDLDCAGIFPRRSLLLLQNDEHQCSWPGLSSSGAKPWFTIPLDLKTEQCNFAILLPAPDSAVYRRISCFWSGYCSLSPTGESSTPFAESLHGVFAESNASFAPLDDRAGHNIWCFVRSAGISNDLRPEDPGQRIKIPHEDGSYEIPERGTCFQGTPQTKPEIYVMVWPKSFYRISVTRPGMVYLLLWWSKVRMPPDDSLDTRLARGYDESTRQGKPAYFGWPAVCWQ